MPSGLAALLDDVATITKMAAASLDDISAAAGKAGVKAAGVVIDPRARIADHLADRQGVSAQQTVVYPSGGASAQRFFAVGAHAVADDWRGLSLL
jgi:Protein of unknown function (DUF808)